MNEREQALVEAAKAARRFLNSGTQVARGEYRALNDQLAAALAPYDLEEELARVGFKVEDKK